MLWESSKNQFGRLKTKVDKMFEDLRSMKQSICFAGVPDVSSEDSKKVNFIFFELVVMTF